jgi:4-amino-4-deoxy-L-arabinose transferase-like glycosyltransferase
VASAITLTLILLLYIALQIKNFVPSYTEADIDGYLWLTKRIATLQPLAIADNSPFHFQDHLWVQTHKGLVTTKFAPGSALLMAPFYFVFGDVGPFLVPPLAGILTLIAAFLLFRRWMGPVAALLAVLCVALNPLFLIYTSYILTHAVDMCLVTCGMLFLFRYLDTPRISDAIGAGLTLGFAVTVRHANALLLLPLLAVIVISWLRSKPRRPTLWALASYAAFPLALMVYNAVLFGNPLRTGYSLTHEQSAFSLAMLTFNYTTYMEGAFSSFLFLALPLGALGAILLGPWQLRLTRALWILPIFLIYMSYYWFAPRPVSYRFLLVLLPAFVGCMYALIDQYKTNRWARHTAMALISLTTLAHDQKPLQATWEGRTTINSPNGLAAGNLLAAKLNPDAVVFTDNRFAHHLGQRRQFKVYDVAAFRMAFLRNFPADKTYTLEDAATGKVPPRTQPQRLQFIRDFYANQTNTSLQQLKLDLIDQHLTAGKQVAFFLPKNAADAETAALKKRWSITPREKLELPWPNPRPDRPPTNETWQLLEIRPTAPTTAARTTATP